MQNRERAGVELMHLLHDGFSNGPASDKAIFAGSEFTQRLSVYTDSLRSHHQGQSPRWNRNWKPFCRLSPFSPTSGVSSYVPRLLRTPVITLPLTTLIRNTSRAAGII